MNDIVREYCAIAEQGAPFDDPRLAALRDRMTEADIVEVDEWLRASAESDFKEARALETYRHIKFEDESGEAAAGSVRSRHARNAEAEAPSGGLKPTGPGEPRKGQPGPKQGEQR